MTPGHRPRAAGSIGGWWSSSLLQEREEQPRMLLRVVLGRMRGRDTFILSLVQTSKEIRKAKDAMSLGEKVRGDQAGEDDYSKILWGGG